MYNIGFLQSLDFQKKYRFIAICFDFLTLCNDVLQFFHCNHSNIQTFRLEYNYPKKIINILKVYLIHKHFNFILNKLSSNIRCSVFVSIDFQDLKKARFFQKTNYTYLIFMTSENYSHLILLLIIILNLTTDYYAKIVCHEIQLSPIIHINIIGITLMGFYLCHSKMSKIMVRI